MRTLFFLLLSSISLTTTAQKQWAWNPMYNAITVQVSQKDIPSSTLFIKSNQLDAPFTNLVKVSDSVIRFEGLEQVATVKIITNKPDYLIKGDLSIIRTDNGVFLTLSDGYYYPYEKNRYGVLEPSVRKRKSLEGVFDPQRKGGKNTARQRSLINANLQRYVEHFQTERLY